MVQVVEGRFGQWMDVEDMSGFSWDDGKTG